MQSLTLEIGYNFALQIAQAIIYHAKYKYDLEDHGISLIQGVGHTLYLFFKTKKVS